MAARRLVAMSGPFQLPSAGGGEGQKRKRQNFGTVPKCGECATCMRPTLKKSCLRNRPPQAQGNASGFYASAAARLQPPQPSVLESLPRPDHEKPAVPRGVAGFRLPIAPQQHARKWSRQWCVRCAAGTRSAPADARARLQGAAGGLGAGRPAVLGAAVDARRVCVATLARALR